MRVIENYEHILNGIKGVGQVDQLNIKFTPYETIQIRPNVLISKAAGKKIIHLGCTDHINYIEQRLSTGSYLHKLLTDVSEDCIGIDIAQEAIDYLKNKGIDNILYADITSPNIESIKKQKWDYMILGELVEHTENPVAFMKQIKENYGEYIDKYIITVPNALGLIFAYFAREYGIESINSDHKYWFTPYTIQKVLYAADYEVEDVIMCCYESSVGILANHYQELCQKPILLDDIVVICK